MDALFGMKVVASPHIPEFSPNFKLADGDYIGDAFRERMQAWCNEFFGVHRTIYVFQDPFGRGQTVATHPGTVALARVAIPEQQYSEGG